MPIEKSVLLFDDVFWDSSVDYFGQVIIIFKLKILKIKFFYRLEKLMM